MYQNFSGNEKSEKVKNQTPLIESYKSIENNIKT